MRCISIFHRSEDVFVPLNRKENLATRQILSSICTKEAELPLESGKTYLKSAPHLVPVSMVQDVSLHGHAEAARGRYPGIAKRRQGMLNLPDHLPVQLVQRCVHLLRLERGLAGRKAQHIPVIGLVQDTWQCA